jgi:hypothetical protein
MDSMGIILDLSKVNRETALKTWLAYQQIGYRELAEQVGVDPSFISYMVQGKRKSRKVAARLLALGVPAELLPDQSRSPRSRGGLRGPASGD